MKVLISTAGLGSRMGRFQSLNKALLPVRGKAAISHIFERAPVGSQFVVALGHQSEQVRDFISVNHPDVTVEYIEVSNYCGDGSGPLQSLYECRSVLDEPFVYWACDTIVGCTLSVDYQNTIYFSRVDYEPSYTYIVGTKPVEAFGRFEGDQAFIGVMAIQDTDQFWKASEVSLSAGRVELCDAITKMLPQCNFDAHLVEDWIDIGTEERYDRAVRNTTAFDFSKPGEFLYISDNRVTKWFDDPNVVDNRILRAELKPEIFPRVEKRSGNFYSYRYLQGTTLYERCDAPVLTSFLTWMTENVWEERDDDISSASYRFYVEKTRDRLSQFRAKYPDWREPRWVNGEMVLPMDELLDRFSLDEIADKAVASPIHGDLQFDNIIKTQHGFCLIDWRQDFGGLLEVGDIHYDFAKLLGGITVNYHDVKQNLLTYSEHEGHVTIDCLQGMFTNRYRDILKTFVEISSFDFQHIEIIMGIIFLNMAPLHAEPFDKFLYALAQYVLTDISERT